MSKIMENAVLLADPNSNVWEFAQKVRDYISKEKEEIRLYETVVKTFRNKEIKPFSKENIRKKDVFFIQDSNQDPNYRWAELMLIKDSLLSASAESVSFVLPEMPYSRQDRKDESRVPISARTFARSISPYLKRIITMDLHAPQIQGFYPENLPIDNLYSFPVAVSHLRENHKESLENLVIVSPDAGGVDRVKSFAKRLAKANLEDSEKHNYTKAMINKTRIEAGEIDSMELVGNVKDKDVLIVDDIIDSGKTLCEASKLLKENGARKLFCYGTHGLFTEGMCELEKNFDVIMTSNTHFRKKGDLGKVEIIDMSEIFAEAIYRAQKGLSVSKFFE
jgi:ribose-phosphate pyrophosphokinase